MPTFNATSNPENFFTVTSDMLLQQPDSQYLYALMFLNALRATLPEPSELMLPGQDVPPIGGTGAPYTPAERDRLILADPMSTDVIAANVDFKGLPGTTVRINRPTYTNSTYTLASRRVASGTTISTTPITVGAQQTNLTLERFAGPYDNGAPRPYAIERWDSQYGVHNAAKIHGTHLKRDFHRFVDSVIVSLLDLAATAVYPEGMSAVNDATSAGQFTMTFEQITRVEQAMDDANLPTFPDGFRLLSLTPTQVQQLQNDPDYQESATPHPLYNVLFPSYVKSVGRFHIFKDNTLTVTNNSSSVPIHYGHAIAPGALLAGMGEAPRIAPSDSTNFGETLMVIWLAYLAFGLANNSFVVSVRSSG